jgi:hypothetical protein
VHLLLLGESTECAGGATAFAGAPSGEGHVRVHRTQRRPRPASIPPAALSDAAAAAAADVTVAATVAATVAVEHRRANLLLPAPGRRRQLHT